jgi:hypothetical protein
LSEDVRRAEIAGRAVVRDRFELLLGVADSAGNRRTAERMRAGFEDIGARRQVVREAVVQDIARTKAGSEKRARSASRIRLMLLGLEDRTRRHIEPARLAGRDRREAAERWRTLLQFAQIGFA